MSRRIACATPMGVAQMMLMVSALRNLREMYPELKVLGS
jgi:hypothetical protein